MQDVSLSSLWKSNSSWSDLLKRSKDINIVKISGGTRKIVCEEHLWDKVFFGVWTSRNFSKKKNGDFFFSFFFFWFWLREVGDKRAQASNLKAPMPTSCCYWFIKHALPTAYNLFIFFFLFLLLFFFSSHKAALGTNQFWKQTFHICMCAFE